MSDIENDVLTDVTTDELAEVDGGLMLLVAAFCFGVGIGNAINDAMGVTYGQIHC
jgi:hypothetical protein